MKPLMTGNLSQRFAIASLLVTGIALLFCALLLYRQAFPLFDRELGARLLATAGTVTVLLDAGELDLIGPGEGDENAVVRSLQERLREVARQAGLHQVVVIDAAGNLVVGSESQGVRGDELPMLALDQAELQETRQGRAVASTLYQDGDGRWYKTAWAPLREDGQKPRYHIGVEAEAAFFEGLADLQSLFLLLTAGVLLTVLLLSLIAARALTRPLVRLTDAAEALGDGRFELPETMDGQGEVARLGRAFNEMAGMIRTRQEVMEGTLHNTRERMGEVNRLLDLLAASIPSALVVFDSGGKLTFANRRSGELLFASPEGPPGITIAELADHLTDLTPDERESLRALRPLEARRLCLPDADGNPLHIRLAGFPLRDGRGGARGYTLLCDDVSREVELEAIAGRKVHLETLGEFSAHIAHELRNPLGAIRGFAELVRRTAGEGEKSSDYAGEILQEVSGLDGMITDFLQYARPQVHQATETDLSTIIERVVFSLNDMAASRGVNLGSEIATGLGWYGDGDMLRQVLTNLVKNGVEATPAGGRVEIRAGQEADGGLQVSVLDTGPGIDPADMERIFDPFFTRKASGTGLGLARVQHQVEAAGGAIHVQNRPESGAEFTLRLPAMERENDGSNPGRG